MIPARAETRGLPSVQGIAKPARSCWLSTAASALNRRGWGGTRLRWYQRAEIRSAGVAAKMAP
jgi:hypothetical protein